jgi:hypothetical protein
MVTARGREDGMTAPLALGYDDGSDMLPSHCEQAIRPWVAAMEATENDLRARDGQPLVTFRLGALRWSTPIPTSDPADVPEPGERWARLSSETSEATHEAAMRISLGAEGLARVADVGTPTDLVTRGTLSMVDATCIWGNGDWPVVAVVLFRVGKARRVRWTYAARFVQHYRRAP